MESSSGRRGLSDRVDRIRRFVRQDMWDIEVADLTRMRATLLWWARTVVLVVRGFVRDQCPLRASALTYITLVTIVPAMALLFSVAKAFGAMDKLSGIFLEKIPFPEVRDWVGQVLSHVQGTDFSALGWTGLVILVYGWLRGLGSVEKTFNDIWGVRRSRSLTRKVSDYLCVSVIVPVLIVVAMGVNASLSSQTVVGKATEWLGPLAWLYLKLLKGLPFLSVIVAFTAFYMFMPNTQVKIRSAMLASVVAGLLWNATNQAYFHGQVAVSKFSPVYGTFAALPAFLVWLYLGWLIVIFGAEVSFAHQNADTYPREMQEGSLPQAERERIALEILGEVVERYQDGAAAGPWRAKGFQGRSGVPIRRINAVVEDLVRAGVLAEVAGRPPGYVPGRAPDRIQIADVLAALRQGGESAGAEGKLPAVPPEVRDVLRRVHEGSARALEGVTLKDLARGKGRG